jgi:REP element-mobilizing transposase RayT
MVIGYHVILGMYGFWMPNDPRGSYSRFVGSWDAFRYGKATTVKTRQSVAAAPHDHSTRLAAKQTLAYPAVELSGVEARHVARGCKDAAVESGYVLWALAILPDHVHMVLKRTGRKAETMAGHMRARATQSLREFGDWPSERPVWGKRGRRVYLDSPADIRHAIRYVEQNPIKEGKRLQKWSFVVPYDV